MPFEGPFPRNEKPELRGFAKRRAEAGLDPRTGEPLQQEVSASVVPGWSAIPAQYEARDPYAAIREHLSSLPEGSTERNDLALYLAVLDDYVEGRFETPDLQALKTRVEDRLRQRKLLQ